MSAIAPSLWTPPRPGIIDPIALFASGYRVVRKGYRAMRSGRRVTDSGCCLWGLILCGGSTDSGLRIRAKDVGNDSTKVVVYGGNCYTIFTDPANLFYFFVKVDSSANVPTIKGSGSDSITAGGATANTYAGLTAQGSHVILWCDGTQWWQLA